MSYPFLIWAMQRTGGTPLTELLTQISEHPSAEHEPFNWRGNKPREFASVTRTWHETQNVAAASAALSEILSQCYLIKHCYELHPMSFNSLLMKAAAETDYRHVLLLRRDETARLISKFAAQKTGAWFRDYAATVVADLASGKRRLDPLPVEQIVERYNHCRKMTAAIRQRMQELGVMPHLVYYEDLYGGDREARLGHLDSLLGFLGFDAQTVAEHRGLIDDKIFNSGEDIPSVARFAPNIAEVRAALAAADRDTAAELPGDRPKASAPGRHRRIVGGMWDEIGRLQLEFLKEVGLLPQHRVLDIGCGCLRGGVKIIRYLEPDHYFGIDADKELLRAGYETELELAGLTDRLPRRNLYCSRRFRHERLPQGTIDYGICAAVMTHLPFVDLRLCLTNAADYFRAGGKLFVSFFEHNEDTEAPDPAALKPGAGGAYHYRAADMIAAADGTPWRARYIGEWNHPRAQRMVEYERV